MKRHLFLLLILLLCSLSAAAAADEITIKSQGQHYSFYDNTFLIDAPADGLADISVQSLGCVYQLLRDIPLTQGEQTWHWDGLGFQGEPIPQGQYDLAVSFHSGEQTAQGQCSFNMGKPKQALLYVLPSCDTLYLEDKSGWSIQFELTVPGKMIMELSPAEAPDQVIHKMSFSAKKGACRETWAGKITGQKRMAPGEYIARCYAQAAPAYVHSFRLTVSQDASPKPQVQETGPVMPSRSATDEQIWQLMIAPAVIFNTEEGAGNPIYAQPTAGSAKLGYVHGKGTALQVIRFTEDHKWAYIGAWILNHSTYVEGYAPVKNLTAVLPAQDYGILIDKQTQTMTLFDHGRRAGSIRISTGKPISKSTLKRETEAGSYLTVTRITPFGNDGFHYDYPIRYNGANLLHTLGWQSSGNRRDYTIETASLGSRASHGCTRMERFTGDQPLNAWWMWTHLRWNTRVIIMDNPVERAADIAAFGGNVSDMPYTGKGTNSWD